MKINKNRNVFKKKQRQTETAPHTRKQKQQNTKSI